MPKRSKKTLPYPQKTLFRWRWMCFSTWNCLHRVAKVLRPAKRGEMPIIRGITACGLTREMQMPGLFSRLSLKR